MPLLLRKETNGIVTVWNIEDPLNPVFVNSIPPNAGVKTVRDKIIVYVSKSEEVQSFTLAQVTKTQVMPDAAVNTTTLAALAELLATVFFDNSAAGDAVTTGLLQAILSAQQAAINIAALLYEDGNGDFVVGVETLDNLGVPTIVFHDLQGNIVVPVPPLAPIAANNYDSIQSRALAVASGTGYTIGDILFVVLIYNPNIPGFSPTGFWYNLNTNAVIATPPDADVSFDEEFDKVIVENTTQIQTNTADTVTALASLDGKDFATQTTLAAILAKIIANPATLAEQQSQTTKLTSLDGKDYATQTTLAAILARLALGQTTMASSLPVTFASNQSPLPTSFDSSNLGAFGDLMTAELTPVYQTDAIYGLLTQQVSNTISGTGALVDTNAGRYRVQSGTTATTGSAVLQSTYPFRYRAGQGILTRFTTVFDTPNVGNVQEIGVGNTVDKYCFGYNGASYGILHRNNGVDTWYPQANWNGDKCNGSGASLFTITPTNGNVCQIIYPFLGYGNIRFYIQNPATSLWLLVHTIQYANSSTAIQISNPSLGMWVRSANTGANTTNTTCYVGSFAAFVIGKKEYTSTSFGTDNLKTGVSAETNIISLRNATTFNGQPNKAIVRIRSISFSSDGGNGAARMRLKKGATVGGSPAFTTINGTTANNGVTITNGQSVCSQDTAGTTVTGGTVDFNTGAARNGNTFMDVTSFNLFLFPGETYTFSVLSQASSDITVSINWDEDI